MATIFNDGGLGSGTFIVQDGTKKEIPEKEVVRENNLRIVNTIEKEIKEE